MTWIFGSARIDENGHAGWDGKAVAGDQKQKSSPDYKGEVSMQNFYNSSKGWNCFEWKDPALALKAAAQTINACNNPHIGYDQSQRTTLINYVKANNITDLAKVDKDVECDCSALMRCVVYMVSGIDPGNFRTINQKSYLEKTGLFKATFKYTSGVKLKTGTILCTCTTGHTGMIVKGEDVLTETTTATTTGGFDMAKLSDLKKGSTGNQVKALQTLLIGYGYSCGSMGADGDFGSNTLKAVKAYQTAKKLTVDGEVGQQTWGSLLGL